MLARTWRSNLVYFLLGLVAIIASVAAFIAYLATDVKSTSITALPIWYWALVACPPITMLVLTIARPYGILPDKDRSPNAKAIGWVNVARAALTASLFLILAGLSLIGQPTWGGLTAIFIMVGIIELLLLASSLIRLQST